MNPQKTKGWKAAEKGRDDLSRCDSLTAFFPKAPTEATKSDSLEVVPVRVPPEFCKTEAVQRHFQQSERWSSASPHEGAQGLQFRREGSDSRRGFEA